MTRSPRSVSSRDVHVQIHGSPGASPLPPPWLTRASVAVLAASAAAVALPPAAARAAEAVVDVVADAPRSATEASS